MKQLLYFTMTVLIASTSAIADRLLEEAEVLELLEQRCQRPMPGWIQQGRIEAVHLCFDTRSGKAVETQESVITDGDRFNWNIRIASQDKEVATNGHNVDDFLMWNQNRIFNWDGFSYTLYFKPGNHAIVYENPAIPVNVSGPLKAGHIPWGQGMFTFQNLSAGRPFAREIQTREGARIFLSVEPVDEIRMEFVMDEDKDNAVLSYTLIRPASRVVQTYSNYIDHQGRWVPMHIIIDRYVNGRLQSTDEWDLTTIDESPPKQNAFVVPLQDEALIERHTPLLEKPAFYRHSHRRDIEPLFEKRVMAALKKDLRKQNCGTVAVEQILSEFGISAADEELASLIRPVSGDTSLFRIQELMKQKGLFCLPVKTDIQGLTQFSNAQVLLHFPAKKHFILLDRVKKQKVWLIDLDRQTFYRSMNHSRFKQEWAGIALVVSDKPLLLGKNDKPIPDKVLRNIVGSADYSCQLVEGSVIEYCPGMSSMGCSGRYTIWQDYYACQPGSEGEFCSGTGRVGGMYSSCVEVGDNECHTSGSYTAQSIRMCTP